MEIGLTGYGGGTPVIFPAAWLLANDTDVNDDPLTAALFPGGGYNTANGHIAQNGDGSFTYTPNHGAVTSDSFQYKAYDGSHYSVDPATVTLTLTNPPPIAVDDGVYSAVARGTDGYGGGLTISAPGVLGNDIRTTGEWLSASVLSQPSHGSVSMNADGSFSYTPTALYTGSDSFTYQVSDGYATDSGIVNLSVVNQAPTVVNDSYSMMAYGGYGGSLSVSSPGVLNNDSDPDAHPLTASLVSGPSSGSLTFNANGSFNYTSAAGVTGPVTFTYRAYDGMAYSSNATVTITISNPLMFAGAPLANSSAQAVTLAQAQAVLTAAGERWLDAGLSSATLNEVLAGVSIVVTDLPGAQLSGFAGSVIYVDINAAGYGWNLDTSDDHFTAGNNESTANAGSTAAGQVDLLTALEHELGHLFGLPHSSSPGNIMNDELDLGVRRSVTAHDAALAELMYQANKRRG